MYIDQLNNDIIANEHDFPYTKIILYKICDNKIPVNHKVNKFFNKLE